MAFPSKRVINSEKNLLQVWHINYKRDTESICPGDNATLPQKEAQAAVLHVSTVRNIGEAAECRECSMSAALAKENERVLTNILEETSGLSLTALSSPKPEIRRAEETNKVGFSLPFCLHCHGLAEGLLYSEANIKHGLPYTCHLWSTQWCSVQRAAQFVMYLQVWSPNAGSLPRKTEER